MKIDAGKVYKLKGAVRHYDWGGTQYIPALLGVDNSAGEPFAEYWMGAHPSAPSKLVTEAGQEISLHELFRSQPGLLGEAVNNYFEELPYLFKILDVKQMLSIQVHPSKEEAEKGFDAEEEKGIAIDAPNRNYKDRNHKPEVMVALSEFWLLHGFRPAEELKKILGKIPQFRSLLQVFEAEGYQGLFTYVMELPQHEVDAMLLPLVQKEVRRRSFHESERDEPGYWVGEYYLNRPAKNIDKGIFAIYFLNLVELQPGEVIFQAAGVPHAYLQGQNVELMANSDNVLRAGLTSKHMDIAELARHTNFAPVIPEVLTGDKERYESNFTFPVKDFGLAKLELHPQQTHETSARSPEIMICVAGGVTVAAANTLSIKRGEAFVCFPGTHYTISSNEESLLFRAFVPV